MLPAAHSQEPAGMALTPEAKAKAANPFSISSILSRSEPKRQLLCWEPGLLAKPTPWYPWVRPGAYPWRVPEPPPSANRQRG